MSSTHFQEADRPIGLLVSWVKTQDLIDSEKKLFQIYPMKLKKCKNFKANKKEQKIP